MVQKHYYFLSVILQCCYFSWALAAPEVESIASTNNLQQITVHGVNFGQGPNIVMFDDFDEGIVGEFVAIDNARIGSWDPYVNKARGTYTVGGDNNIGFGIRDFRYSDGHKQATLIKVFGESTEIFVSYDVIVPNGNFFAGSAVDNQFPITSTWKFAWIIDGDRGFGNEGNFDLCIPSHNGGGNTLVGGNDGNLYYHTPFKAWWSFHNYNNISFWLKGNNETIDPIDGHTRLQTISEKGFFKTESSDAFTPGTTTSFDRINFPGWWGNADWSNFNAVYDNIYIAIGENSQARVELTNNEIYEDSTSIKILPPINWSNNKIEINLPENIGPKYLFITDSDCKRPARGYQICSSCPAYPANLSIK